MNEQELIQKIDAFVSENADNLQRDIARLVAVPSVSDESAAAPGAPYGPGARKALDVALEIAREIGLTTNDGDGYVGWADLPGKEPGQIATITHVDIVPEGEGWTGDAFKLENKDGWLIGRGVADDKGPSILCLYIARFFKEMGLPLRYTFRVLLGCDEETGMSDVAHYLAHHEQPLFAFSPDAEFPVCNGEKGNYNAWFSSAPAEGNILEFDCGLALNVIPGKATCVVKADATALAGSPRVSVEDAGGGGVRLTAAGVGGHAAMPENTLNAIGVMVDYMLENKLCTGNEEKFLQLLHLLHSAPDGSGLGIDCADEVFKGLTINGGVIKMEGGRLWQSIDIRYPTATTGEALTQKLGAVAKKYGCGFECHSDGKPFYIDADSPSIQTLLRTYNEVFGKNDAPFTMGGGTYARHFANAVSYGPGRPGAVLPDFVGPEHGANEGAYLPDLLNALKVYILAVWRLQEVDF